MTVLLLVGFTSNDQSWFYLQRSKKEDSTKGPVLGSGKPSSFFVWSCTSGYRLAYFS